MENKEINCIDVALAGEIKSKGTAYYRLDDGLFDFLNKIEEKGKVIGFSYEPGSRNLGIIMADKDEPKAE